MSKGLFSFLFIALFAIFSVNSLRLTASPQSNLPACTDANAQRDNCNERKNSYGAFKCKADRDCKSTNTCSSHGWCKPRR